MKERPIIFSAPMVRAMLEGRKTQTRRVLKPQPPFDAQGCHRAFENARDCWWDIWASDQPGVHRVLLPYEVGMRLWVREKIELRTPPGNRFPSPVYSADGADVMDGKHWANNHKFMRRRVIPSIHMPRWASRITLEVTGVKVERLQSISGADAVAEGVWCSTCEAMQKSACHHLGCPASRQNFADLWTAINGPGAWDANPWVAAYTFRVLDTKGAGQ